MTESSEATVFHRIGLEDTDNTATEIESCCMNCYETVCVCCFDLSRVFRMRTFSSMNIVSFDSIQGVTRMLLTLIPFYKETVVMSFKCEHCGFENNEIQAAGEIEPNGCRIQLEIVKPDDLNRRVVKSDGTSVKFVQLDFEIPSKSQKGEVTTIEGIISRSIAGLQQDQTVRRIEHPEVAEQIDAFVCKLESLKLVETPFTIILEDISGNSRVENPYAPNTDPQCTVTHFVRTQEQNHELGMFTQEELNDKPTKKEGNVLKTVTEDDWTLEELHGEVLQFETDCPSCKSKCETNMKVTSIPHFKEVIIMSTNCDVCGARTNEVKSSGGIEDKGVRIIVDVRDREDMSRDILKVCPLVAIVFLLHILQQTRIEQANEL